MGLRRVDPRVVGELTAVQDAVAPEITADRGSPVVAADVQAAVAEGAGDASGPGEGSVVLAPYAEPFAAVCGSGRR